MSKRTKAQMDDVKYYANKKDLDSRIADYCHTREQVDSMLETCSYILEEKYLYDYSKEIACDKPGRVAKAMRIKLESLAEYYENLGVTDVADYLWNLNTPEPHTKTKEHLDDIRIQIIFWIDHDGSFTPKQKDNLTKATVQCFKESNCIYPKNNFTK